ncbi:MAG: ATP-binding protein [Clostridia bacterium]|nr:ATP-binding protein [Clostridia bacterium]
MKLLRVKASRFKNCCDGFTIDLTAKSKKTAEDKEYELQEIAPDLYVFNTVAFIGKNASGKTTAIELLDCAYSILGEFRLEGKHYSYDGVQLELTFYHEGFLYLYETALSSGKAMGNQAVFLDERLCRKEYCKTNVKEIFDREGYGEIKDLGDLPEDTSNVFFVLKKKQTRAAFYDSFSGGPDTYQTLFRVLKNYDIGMEVLAKIIRIFDENIRELTRADDHHYRVVTGDEERIMSSEQLIYFLSGGTTKGILLYTLMVASLKEGFDLLVDGVENHFHKTLVENMISLYKDRSVNRNNATLIFTTHYCEILDLMGRQDNIWICNANSRIHLTNMYGDFNIRPELLKSRQYYNNAFRTAVNYEDLMALKKVLKKSTAHHRKAELYLADILK